MSAQPVERRADGVDAQHPVSCRMVEDGLEVRRGAAAGDVDQRSLGAGQVERGPPPNSLAARSATRCTRPRAGRGWCATGITSSMAPGRMPSKPSTARPRSCGTRSQAARRRAVRQGPSAPRCTAPRQHGAPGDRRGDQHAVAQPSASHAVWCTQLVELLVGDEAELLSGPLGYGRIEADHAHSQPRGCDTGGPHRAEARFSSVRGCSATADGAATARETGWGAGGRFASPGWRPRTCSARRRRSGCSRQAPLAARLRPRTLDDVVGQDHLLGPGRPLRALIEADRLSSVHPLGPAGHRQDDAGPAHRRHHRQGVRAAVGGHARR